MSPVTKLTTVWSDSHYKEGITSGRYCKVDIFEEVSNFIVEIFEEVSNFIVDIFEDCGDFNDGNEEDCNRIDDLGVETERYFKSDSQLYPPC